MKKYVDQTDLSTVLSWCVAQGVGDLRTREAVMRLCRHVVGPTTLVLTGVGSSKICVIRAVREITGLRVAEAKDWVESYPQHLSTLGPASQLPTIAKALRLAGATIEARLL